MRIRRWIAWGLLTVTVLAIGGTALGLTLAGYGKYVVRTGSMVPSINPGDLVIDQPPDGHYQVGEVITFRHGEGDDLVTHRIVAITDRGIKTKGDANPTPDAWTIPTEFVEGEVTFRIPKGGYVVTFLDQPSGLAAVLVGIAGMVLLWRLFFPSEPDNVNRGRDGEPEPATEAAETDTDAPDTQRNATVPATAASDGPPDSDAPAKHRQG